MDQSLKELISFSSSSKDKALYFRTLFSYIYSMSRSMISTFSSIQRSFFRLAEDFSELSYSSPLLKENYSEHPECTYIWFLFFISIYYYEIYQSISLQYIIMIIKIITIFLLLLSVCSDLCSAESAEYGCTNCNAWNLTYYCVECDEDNGYTLYLQSCRNDNEEIGVFIALAIVLLIVYFFMLVMGIGVYHSYFQNIQLASIITWAYGSQSGAWVLQITNLGIQVNNDFPSSFGGQFIAIMAIMFIFWVIVLFGYKFPHTQTAKFFGRKRIIFPVRFLGFFFNMIIFTSLAEISTITDSDTLFSLVLAVLALIKGLVIYAGTLFLCNIKKFKVDDPQYYVITQKLTNSGWYSKNNLFVNQTVNLGILFAFTFGFTAPEFSCIVMLVLKGIYFVYEIFLPWIKYRYRIVNALGNLFLIGIIISSMGCSWQPAIDSVVWNEYKTAYYVIIIVMCCVLILMMIVQVLTQRHLIVRQCRQGYGRYCVCCSQNKQEQGLQMDTQRYNSVKLQPNEIYQKEMPTISVSVSS